MTRFASLSLCLVALVACGDSGSTGSTGGDDGDDVAESGEPADPELDGIVKLHNDVRAEVGTDPLVWSSEAASVAKKYAEECNWGHNADRGSYGENIFASTGGSSPGAVVGSWAEEKANYDPATGDCASGKVCGHYTQIVWSTTTAVGCAKASCTKNSPFGGDSWDYWVCNYDPPGNYSGKKAY